MRQKDHQKPITLSDWLLAETTRRIELRSGTSELDDAATRAAVALENADIRARIVERARKRDASGGLRKSIADALNGLRWAFGLLLLIGLLAGGAAAQTVLAADGVIRLSWAILTLLGFPLLMLFIWLLVTVWPRRKKSGRGLPGRALWWLSSLFARRFSTRPDKRYLAASLSSYGRQHGARLASLATHAFWSCFFIGALVLLWAAFIGLRFDFTWGTTIIDSALMEQVIIRIGQPPAWLTGLDVPDHAQIMTLLSEQSTAADRRSWALYLMSVLAFYGLLPRLLLAAGFALAQRRSRPTLDLSAAGYLQLLPVLTGATSQRIGPQGAAAPSLDSLSQSSRPAMAGSGRPVLIGVELEDPNWPPQLDDDWLERIHEQQHESQKEPPQALGRANDRTAQNQLHDAIVLLEPKPERIIALCSMLRTPDRGVGAWLARLNELSPVEIYLTEADLFNKRNGDLDTRLNDWQQLAERFGLAAPRLIESVRP